MPRVREEAQGRWGSGSPEVSVDLSPWGLVVGHATDDEGATGLTVVRGADSAMRAGGAVFGRAPGTREFLTVSPDHLVDRVDAILLTGGSAYGLDAAAGVMRWMEEHGRGFPVAGGVVPIVPAAVIFDLAPLGRFDARPTPTMAYEACERARAHGVEEGSVGAGVGATVGKAAGRAWAMKGGFGIAAAHGIGASVAAMAVVNALGDVRGADGAIIAGARKPDGTFVDSARLAAAGEMAARIGDVAAPTDTAGQNTTLAVVAVDAMLTRLELAALARAAGAALYRRITPTGTSLDGDVLFAVCPHDGRTRSRANPATPHVEALAVQALESALERAVRTARGRDGIPGVADSAGSSSWENVPDGL
jgi:L-aminopeptidase/D-esterase-like protein